MGIKTPFISEIAPKTYAINEFGLTAMFLLKGTERSLLIDTGCGVCELKELADSLAGGPYDVVLTHGHLDHAGGCGAFDKIYLNEKDFHMVEEISREALMDYCDTLGRSGGYDVYDYEPSMVKGIAKMPEMINIKEGDVFHLGDRDISVFETPGHTRGSIVLLDRKNRIIFTGDACNPNTLLLQGTPETLLASAKKIKSLESFFDQNFNGHIGYAGVPTCLSMPDSVTDDVIHICEMIISGEAEPVEAPFLGGVRKGVNYGSARVVYD